MGGIHKKRRGQSLVETAMVLPILILIILGLLEFGRAFFIYTVVSNAAREGARFGLVQPLNTTGIERAAQSRLVLVPTDTVSIVISYDDGVHPITDPLDIVQGESRVVVAVEHDFAMITPILADLFPPLRMEFTSARTIAPAMPIHKPTP